MGIERQVIYYDLSRCASDSQRKIGINKKVLVANQRVDGLSLVC